MNRRIIITPIARTEIRAISLSIAKDSAMQGHKFAEDVRATLETLAQFPGVGRSREEGDPRTHLLRSFPVRDHPNHLLFYAVEEEAIVLVRVIHGARDIPWTIGNLLGIDN